MKQKIKSKMEDIYQTISIITLNVNGLKTNQMQRLLDWIKLQAPAAYKRNTFDPRLKLKAWQLYSMQTITVREFELLY